nr:MAG TPA: hypothetical protein [Caudoviricetes sp.]
MIGQFVIRIFSPQIINQNILRFFFGKNPHIFPFLSVWVKL